MAAAKMESGVQLLARLGARPSVEGVEPALFGEDKPQPGTLTEFYGEDATGKTQAVLHLAANAILPKTWCGFTLGGLDMGVIIVDTDYHFSMLRLSTILENRITGAIEAAKGKVDLCQTLQPRNEKEGTIPTEDEIEDLMKAAMRKMYIIHCNSTTQVLVTLRSLNVLLGNQPEISVIMLDSVSAFYWTDRSVYGEMASQKGNPQQRLVGALQDLMSTFGVAIIATRTILFQGFKDKNTRGRIEEHVGKISKHKTETWNYMGRAWQQAVSHSYLFTILSNSGSGQCRTVFSVNANDQAGSKKMFCIGDCGLEFL